MNNVNFHTLDDLTAPPELIEKLLTIPHTEKPSRSHRRLYIAAAVILMMIGTFIIYGIFVAPAAIITLDSARSVTLTLNSRGRVLSANGCFGLSGKTAKEAVAVITSEMLRDGSVNKTQNSLIVGVNGKVDSAAIIDSVNGAYDEASFDGCVVALPCEKSGKDALIRYLDDEDNTLSNADLRSASAHELCLLLVSGSRPDDDITVTGAPSESAYIGFDNAVSKALKLSNLAEDELGDIAVSYSIYHGRLIYLVRLNAGNTGEAYLINAVTGATEQAIKAPSDKIDQEVDSIFKQNAEDDPPSAPTDVPTAYLSTQPPTAPNTDAAITPPFDDPTQSAVVTPTQDPDQTTFPTESPTERTPDEYKTVPVTLTELSFITLSPPETAASADRRTLFEGQSIEPRSGEKLNGGSVAVITDPSQLQRFLNDHPYRFEDRNGNTWKNTLTDEDFKIRYLIASVCVISDASYYTTVTDLRSDGDTVYMENSLSYGAAQSGEFYCRTLSLYSVSRSSGIPKNLIVY